MGDSGWGAGSWSAGDEPRARLPRIEDLPPAEQGYDRGAVEAAFDSFYRHAAQLDATLRVLETIEAFHRQAGDLRADIRTLRAASWGPVPERAAWSGSYGTAGYSAESVRGRIPEALPRLAVEVAFIIFVGVGAGLAGLATGYVLLLILGAWLVVGLGELLVSAARPLVRRPPAAVPAVAPAAPPEEPPASAVEPSATPVGEATMLELPPAEPAVEPAADPEPDVEGAASEPAEPPAEPKRWRFRGRRAQPDPEDADEAAPKHVRVLAPEEAPPAAVDPWEEGPELPEAAPGPTLDEPDEPEERAEDTEEPDEAGEEDLEAQAAANVHLIEVELAVAAEHVAVPVAPAAAELEPEGGQSDAQAARRLPARRVRLRRGRR